MVTKFLYLSFVTAVFSKLYDLDTISSIFISPNSSAKMQITSNPTTGYSWRLIPPDSFPIKCPNPSGTFIAANTLALGAPGKQIFELICTTECHEGDTETLTLIYSRPWEKEPVQFKTITVTVTFDADQINN
ncbi:hypothetical protein SteCoe_18036 [Stentor coeruleus]|uniref:Proteinase inhibitor I42 chagasin domain-containing protein n=1 Tax=Stentor coeruleus TaxID=5963 RepID=A0A1R2BXC1_9CILI|nr:hypothetical protein SteCoe_18036 [Stentor coeruleus]